MLSSELIRLTARPRRPPECRMPSSVCSSLANPRRTSHSLYFLSMYAKSMRGVDSSASAILTILFALFRLIYFLYSFVCFLCVGAVDAQVEVSSDCASAAKCFRKLLGNPFVLCQLFFDVFEFLAHLRTKRMKYALVMTTPIANAATHACLNSSLVGRLFLKNFMGAFMREASEIRHKG